MNAPIWRKCRAISEGYVPGWSSGPTPQSTNCLLNASDEDLHVEITV